MKIHFLGATRTVTGSKHLIEVGKHKILLDCGLFQGNRQESFNKNKNLPLKASEIDAVVLSHAHIDHSGNLPVLVKNGFKGKIYCTTATADITKIMLLDSAHIQKQDAEYFERKLNKTALKPIKAIYDEKDALETATHFSPVPLYKKFTITDNIEGMFFNAGHVLGSAIVFLTINDNGKIKKLVFTGDLGRKNRKIIEDPDFISEAEILITESTYGGRLHPDIKKNKDELKRIINNTAKKGGKLIIPSFSFERTQEIIYDLNLLKRKKEIPDLEIIIDSPLSTKITKIFENYPEFFDQEAKKEFLGRGENPFANITYTRTVDESKAINSRTTPCIIISASGMCEAGRIRHHLRNNISNPKNTILIVGFQAEHTLGRRLVEKRPYVKIFDEMHAVKADIEVINGFSGHADRDDLIEFITRIEKLKNIFVVHGENDQCFALIKELRKVNRDFNIDAPEEGDIVEL